MSLKDKPLPGTPGYDAWKMRNYRKRLKAARTAKATELASGVLSDRSAKEARLAGLILEAQRLAEEINRETGGELEGKEMRISFAKVDIPI